LRVFLLSERLRSEESLGDTVNNSRQEAFWGSSSRTPRGQNKMSRGAVTLKLLDKLPHVGLEETLRPGEVFRREKPSSEKVHPMRGNTTLLAVELVGGLKYEFQ
jgi:hypothetical protein